MNNNGWNVWIEMFFFAVCVVWELICNWWTYDSTTSIHFRNDQKQFNILILYGGKRPFTSQIFPTKQCVGFRSFFFQTSRICLIKWKTNICIVGFQVCLGFIFECVDEFCFVLFSIKSSKWSSRRMIKSDHLRAWIMPSF